MRDTAVGGGEIMLERVLQTDRHKQWLCELAVSCEHCNDPLGSIKGEEFLDQFE
jgi:hypothetical protein